MAGLLDGIDPQTALLLGLGSGLLGTAGQGRRATFGEALANGMQAGTQGYRQAIGDRQRAEQLQAEQQMREQQMRLQMEEAARAQGRFGMEQQQFAGQQAEQARKLQEAQQMRELAMRFAKGAPQMALEQGAQAGSVGPTNANADRLQAAPNAGGYDFNGYAEALAGVNPVAALQMKDALRKEVPAGVVVPEGARLADPRTGREMFANPKTDKPDPLQFVDAGDFQIGYDRSGREVVRVPKGVDPVKMGLKYSAEAGGYIPERLDPGQSPTVVPVLPNQAQRTADANDVLTLTAEARNYLPSATGSYIGLAGDQFARAFGYSTKGANAAAQMKALEGNLISKMPKMSGPQSDKDVLLYKQMAGQIGDPTIPREQKEAALNVIEDIARRNANSGPSPARSTPALSPPQRSKIATAADIAYTMRRYPHMTRQQVIQEIEANGYTFDDPMRRRQGGASGGY